jgi:phage-related protein
MDRFKLAHTSSTFGKSKYVEQNVFALTFTKTYLRHTYITYVTNLWHLFHLWQKKDSTCKRAANFARYNLFASLLTSKDIR